MRCDATILKVITSFGWLRDDHGMRRFIPGKGPAGLDYIQVALAIGMCVGCGRVGVELLPVGLGQVTPGADAGAGDGGPFDAGGSPADGGSFADGDGWDPADDGSLGGDSDAAEDAGCPTLCENENGSASCDTGSCVVSCALGYADCDGNPTNGCEANTSDGMMTCGDCTRSCMNAHGASMCTAGLCSSSCDVSYGDCDSDATNGCETQLQSVTSCGACGASCTNAHGTTACPAGTCVPTCASGYANCDGEPSNGCETDLMNDPAHCGSCPRACGTNGQICVAGACQASPCVAGRGECDGNLGVTCETDLTTSLGNCGFCGNACSTANGSPQCSAGSCGVRTCNAGFGNCDSNVANGCETPLASTTAHCGGCGAACTNANGTTSCAASSCVPSCSTGFGDCDGLRQNGCETGLNSVTNCGVCGRSCPAGGGAPTCNAGVCGVSCNLSGTYALKMTLQATWPSGSVIAGGSGTFQFWMKLQGTHSGSSMAATLTECGRFIPDFRASLVNENFNYGYPNSLFDGNFLPSSSATVTLGSSSPGASFTLPPSATQMGINMADPINGSWPSLASGIAAGIRVDHDRDGDPGVTAVYSNTGGRVHPRTSSSVFGFNRADNPYVASRVSFSLNGSLSSCTQSSGAASFSHVDTRIFACNRSGSTTGCTATEADFLDRNCLNYSLGSATYNLLKVADGASCATIRAALP
jgi:hypothetical protein